MSQRRGLRAHLDVSHQAAAASELLHDGRRPPPARLADFPAWNESDLVHNTRRGALAHFIVDRVNYGFLSTS